MTEPSIGPLTRGFLFADLRGYTTFAEIHGDRAAADLLDRYRALVRGVVAGSAGTEIRTEGDSFYVVFPSASAAVGAGLAIAAAAAEATSTEPAQPIRVGVGVHAGEAEERAEGPVGTAVNVAARICAEATAGEVLVSDTVRSLVRTGGRYRFVSRGSHRLKGLAEPVALYRAVPAGEDGADPLPAGAPTRRRATIAVAGSVVALIAVVAVAGLLLAGRPSGPSPSPSPSAPAALVSPSGSGLVDPSPSPTATPFPNGPVPPGTYQTAEFESPIRLTFGDDAWWKVLELRNALRLAHQDLSGTMTGLMTGPQLAGVSIFRPGIGFVGCTDEETTTIDTSSSQAVIDFVIGNPGLEAEAPRATSIGGLDGITVRFRLGPPCGPVPYIEPVFQLLSGTGGAGSDYPGHLLEAYPAAVNEVFVTEVNGELLAVWLVAPEDRWEVFETSARSLLSTLEVVD